MKFADINRRYTEVVAEYMAKGYTINAGTMSASQGEICHIDLTDGVEIIRVYMDSFYRWKDKLADGIVIAVGRSKEAVAPNMSKDMGGIVWTNRLEVITEEPFFKVSTDSDGEKIYTK